MGKLIVVAGGQYGSEAKGHVAAFLGEREDNLLAVRVGGSNAGHTAYHKASGARCALRQLPVAAVRPARFHTELAIAAGSEVDLEVMKAEAAQVGLLRQLAEEKLAMVCVDPQATWVSDTHKRNSAARVANGHPTGGTGKGVGMARRERLRKAAETVKDHANEVFDLGDNYYVNDVGARIDSHLWYGHTVLIEGTQGYKLGVHAGDYPFCTAGDCRAIDFMGQAGVSPWSPTVDELEVWMVYRSYPIRIAGNSGPMYKETSWDKIGVAAEQTTVTHKTRRVGEWDQRLYEQSMAANGGKHSPNVRVAYMFLDYDYPGLAGCNVVTSDLLAAVTEVEQTRIGRPIDLVGTGPDTIVDLEGVLR